MDHNNKPSIMDKKCKDCSKPSENGSSRCANHAVRHAMKELDRREKRRREDSKDSAMVPREDRDEFERSVRQKRSVEMKTEDRDITKQEQTIVKGDMSITTKTEKITSHTVSRIETEIQEYREKFIQVYRNDEAVLKEGTLFRLWKNRVDKEYATGSLEHFCPNATLHDVVQSCNEDFEGLYPKNVPAMASMTEKELNDRLDQISNSGRGFGMASAIKEQEELMHDFKSAQSYSAHYDAARDLSAAGSIGHRLELYGLIQGSFPSNLEIIPTDHVRQESMDDDLTMQEPEMTYITDCQVRDVSTGFKVEGVPVRIAVLFGVQSKRPVMQIQWDQWMETMRMTPIERIPGVPKALLAGVQVQDMVRKMPSLGSCRLFAELSAKKLAGYLEDPLSLTSTLSKVLGSKTEVQLKDWVGSIERYMDQGAGAYLTDKQQEDIEKRQKCVQTIQMICEGPEYRAAELKSQREKWTPEDRDAKEREKKKALASLYK